MKSTSVKLGAVLLLAFFVFLGMDIKEESDWPRWRGSNGDGISPETGWNPKALSKGPRIVWKTNVDSGFSSVSIRGNSLYTMGNRKGQDVVYCLDVRTGKEIWSHSYPCSLGQYPGPRATPAIDGSFVYTLSQEGHLFCFNAENGKVKWQKNITREFGVSPPNWGFAGSPVIEGDLLILNAGVSGLALDKRTGEKVWLSKSGVGGYATPVVYRLDGTQYVAIFGRRALYGVELASGKQLWSFPWVTGHDVNAADPLVHGNRIFISSNYGVGCALIELQEKGPKLVWKNDKMNSHFSSFIYLDGYIYGNDGTASYRRGTFRCLEFETGKEMWGENLGFGSLIATRDTLILFNDRGNLFIAEATPASYREISRAESVLGSTCWTPPVLCRGRIYLRNSRGDLVCIDVS
jgi:outer membrane protein assembly factor BamB